MRDRACPCGFWLQPAEHCLMVRQHIRPHRSWKQCYKGGFSTRFTDEETKTSHHIFQLCSPTKKKEEWGEETGPQQETGRSGETELQIPRSYFPPTHPYIHVYNPPLLPGDFWSFKQPQSVSQMFESNFLTPSFDRKACIYSQYRYALFASASCVQD